MGVKVFSSNFYHKLKFYFRLANDSVGRPLTRRSRSDLVCGPKTEKPVAIQKKIPFATDDGTAFGFTINLIVANTNRS